jgi:hypothetical protein
MWLYYFNSPKILKSRSGIVSLSKASGQDGIESALPLNPGVLLYY